jgi:2-C-methyl-D-erythritol 4-phosphate cytidylyltransferase/2-C-methyl-D-erythritol 2,4-cyclodiphosphate synthase
MNSIIVVAAGLGTRMKCNKNKLLLNEGRHSLIWYTLRNVFASTLLNEAIVVTKREERPFFQAVIDSLQPHMTIKFADGGAARFDSVQNGIRELSPSSEKVLIHDGARPLVDGKAFDQMLEFLSKEKPAAIYGLPCIDTIKMTSQGFIKKTLDRSVLYRAQTPQGFMTSVYKKALHHLPPGKEVTDDASVVEPMGIQVSILPGKESYYKITTMEDWKQFKLMIHKNHSSPFRIGQGYDIHRFKSDRPLILGGVHISDQNGLDGHSDADVLTHAVMDSLLGAAALRDIGYYFPDTDDAYKGISSLVLLEKVRDLIDAKGYDIGNIDVSVISEKPKLSPYISQIKESLSRVLGISADQIGIQASTHEKIGSIGRGEGMAALASSILIRRD